MSRFWQGRTAAETERGRRRSDEDLYESSLLVCQKTSARLSQVLCGALSMAIRIALLCTEFPWTACKAVQFSLPGVPDKILQRMVKKYEEIDVYGIGSYDGSYPDSLRRK